MTTELQTLAHRLTAGHTLNDTPLVLGLEGLAIGIRSNSERLLARLADYFAPVVGQVAPDVEVVAIQCAPLELGLDYHDWRREPASGGARMPAMTWLVVG